MPEDYNSHSEHTVVFLVAPGDILDDRWLIEARIGLETMDTAAVCRTYNVLASEGRSVVAALLPGDQG